MKAKSSSPSVAYLPDTGSAPSHFGSLHPQLLEAVCDALATYTGRVSNLTRDALLAMANPQSEPGDVSLAVAYANLVADDPETVTPHHLKMLRHRFSIEQIHELTRFIRSQLA